MGRPNFMGKSDKDDDKEEKSGSGRPDFLNKAKKAAEDAVEKADEVASSVGRPDFMGGAKDKVEEVAGAAAGVLSAAEEKVEETVEAVKNVVYDAYIADHTVAGGENLSKISEQYYGHQGNWSVIHKANIETIGENANVIVPGQVLKIPKL